MSNIPDRLLSGGARLKFLDDGRICICFNVGKVSASNKLDAVPEICSPPIDVKELAGELGLVVAGALHRLGRWISKKIG